MTGTQRWRCSRCRSLLAWTMTTVRCPGRCKRRVVLVEREPAEDGR